MAIHIIENGTRRVAEDLGTHGSIEVRTGAEIEAPVWPVSPAILFRWEGAPRDARMSQTVAFRGFIVTRASEYRGVDPQPPSTDIRTPAGRSVAQRFPLSAPTGLLEWSIDALHESSRVDPGRAYVTDESYGFTERVDDTVLFYDCPQLWFHSGQDLVATYGGASHVSRLELLGRFRTHLWAGSARVGLVEWVSTWRASATFPEISSVQPRYETVGYYTGPPSDGPTDVELQRMIRRWQRDDVRRPRRR